ncbi:Predicted oxidoreductase, contains short-chain dehydrogenase (SDR) and DUF2520 domains [Salinimicrobium catena]|uniref:Predicted oxidoreductase, contains short-chain dehydrogenase (SDR) and DUF2520 domains n=1 Tax=Salinimicrobium catena TaxID=390640 RepID=A0A1H5KVL0_9FLAO|nr:Rossmann-like and DUF2520 domain-containing protein [Salinimicrobium catena]SDL02423.1 Predicted oxidoreductase, contains short-chain dehydrogenase (SDR) and DUF2520 domains [Salinimicrobium catena]SEE68882.1 Predicted oxidoreductase, contains short-chain dehydrogenase (SDR) and DUF2520 domains [Salinimicrobium catena]
MINLVLLGSGNVATHLYRAFSASEKVQVVQVYNHSENGLAEFEKETPVTTSLDEIFKADVYLLALKDDVIPQISRALKDREGLIAHTSGAVSLAALDACTRAGVFYPLQTFSKQKELNYCEIPFCLEAKDQKDLDLLKILAGEISGKAYEISSAQRKKLHLSAVFVCNFANHLYTIGENICRENEMPFEILQPLIQETANKVKTSSPSEVQTGPAIRHDGSTIEAHLELLNDPDQKEIYQTLTHAIQNFYGKKL